MATLDDKLLGEKLHYYCSSSEDEDEDAGTVQPAPAPEGVGMGGPSGNTGPKGVLQDWRRFKQLEAESREENERERAALAAKLSLTCKSEREEEEEKARQQREDLELEALLEGDPFLESYMAARMKEMMAATQATSRRFGAVVDLPSGDSFLHEVDSEDVRVTVVVAIYEAGAQSSMALLGALSCLAPEHTSVKFCKILSDRASLSNRFKASGVPALLVYRGGELVGSWVQLGSLLGEDFYSSDLEQFLVEHGMIKDAAAGKPSSIRQADAGDDSD